MTVCKRSRGSASGREPALRGRGCTRTEAGGYESRTNGSERDALEMWRVEGGKASERQRASTGVRDRAKGSERAGDTTSTSEMC